MWVKVGDEVQVKCLMVEGSGVIQHILNREIYPVQVELNEADSDGHKIYRFKRDEVSTI